MELRGERRRRRGPARTLVLTAALAVAIAAVATLRVGRVPRVKFTDLSAIGHATPVSVTVEAGGRGLSDLRLELVQGDLSAVLAEHHHSPRSALVFWGPRTRRDELSATAGAVALPGLRSGEAEVRLVARRAGTWLRHPAPAVVAKAVHVRLEPPSLQVISTQHDVRQGGSEAVVYRVDDGAVRDGVQAGDWWFPGHPLPGGGAGERFALFAAPFDLDDPAKIRLVAEDDLGNVARIDFVDRFTSSPYSRGTIELSDRFLERVVPEIRGHTPDLPDRGDTLANYLEINRELRKTDRARLRKLATASRPEFLWRRSFVELPSAKVMAPFAVLRTYFYKGREVDREFHLGFDLASVRRAAIPAAAGGVVAFAGYFGIYGNAVVLDHGYGLETLYGHMSVIEVREGDRVARGQTLGRTGATGLAGGDHLHFAVLLQGLPVNPIEWWDRHWIEDRIARKLGGALPFER